MTTSVDIISTLLAHGMILRRVTSIKTSNMVLAARTTEGCTNPNCKTKKHSTHTTSNWPGGGKKAQFPPNFGQQARANATTSADPPTDPTLSTQTNPTTSGQTNHFVLSAQTMNMPGQSRVLINVPSDHPHMVLISKGFQAFGKGKVPTFLDSGASNVMFVLKEAFVEYKPIDS